MQVVEEYVSGVLSGKVLACKNIKLAAQRHQDDMHRAAIGAQDFPYYWDDAAAERVIAFCHILKPSKGEWAGKPLVLLPWQQFVLAELFGWKRREDDTRRYRIGYIELPRKSGKSTMLAAVGLYMLCADGEPGAEVYSAATTRDQAKQIYDEACAMRDNSLKGWVGKNSAALVVPASKSKFKPLSADASTLDGLNVHCALVDELHEHPDRKVWEKLKTATGSRRQPLLLAITTAGVGNSSFCYSQRSIAERILKRDTHNESYFAFIAAIDDETKWHDEKEWFKANPALGHNLKLNVLRDAYQLAKDNPDELNDFLRYHLNVWTEKLRVWMPMDKWADPACVGSTDEFPDPLKIRHELEEKLKGRVCCGGLDLSATIDITAFVLVFPPQTPDEPWYVLPYFWVPEDNIEKRTKRDHVRYDVWAREGFIMTTPGNAVDYIPVREKIVELSKVYDIREVAFDDWGSQQIVQELQGDGLTVVNFRQGYKSLSAPMKELLKSVLRGKLVHGANPVLRWMASNLVAEQDPAGNIKPNKEKSAEKIDGMVAIIMGLGRAETYKNEAAPEMFFL